VQYDRIPELAMAAKKKSPVKNLPRKTVSPKKADAVKGGKSNRLSANHNQSVLGLHAR
jgi:hypothetical protein